MTGKKQQQWKIHPRMLGIRNVGEEGTRLYTAGQSPGAIKRALVRKR